MLTGIVNIPKVIMIFYLMTTLAKPSEGEAYLTLSSNTNNDG